MISGKPVIWRLFGCLSWITHEMGAVLNLLDSLLAEEEYQINLLFHLIINRCYTGDNCFATSIYDVVKSDSGSHL